MGEQGGDLRALLERHPAGEHLERHAAHRVDVGARVDPLAADLLGGDVVDGADHGVVRACAAVRQGCGDPEVGEVAVPGRVEQHIGGLDVAVHQTVRVSRVEGRSDLLEHVEAASWLEPALAQQVSQRLALDEAHGDVDGVTGLAGAVDGHHVGVVQGCGCT